MKKLLSLLAILVIASAAQAVLPVGTGTETFDHDVFSVLGSQGEFVDWGNWASGSGASGWGGGVGGDFVAQVNTTGGNPGGHLELGVDAHMSFWGRSMGFVHNNIIGPRTSIMAKADVKNLGGVGTFVMKIEWFAGLNKMNTASTATGAIQIDSTVISGLGTGWTNVGFASPVAVPGGANYYTVVVQAEGTGTSYLVDNVTPEPITIALLGLGGLFLRRRK